MNKVQWQRSEKGELELYVFEPDEKGLGGWKYYTKSKYFKSDLEIKGASRGLETMRNCLKNGYQLLDVNGDVVK